MRPAAPVRVLAARLIPGADPALCQAPGLEGIWPSLALLSADCDDATYIALDEATKVSPVCVAYARSLYAGAANASTPLAGEVLGILAGPSPSEVSSGLQAAIAALESGSLGFRPASEEGPACYLAHVVSRTGSFLSREASVPEGTPLAYLIAPPLEAVYGLDAAMKAAQIHLVRFYGPPTETNFGGGLLAGTQSACLAACQAFAQAVEDVAAAPLAPGPGYR